MSVLDQLYNLEIEFHRMFRAEGVDAHEAAAVHLSYALQNNYEPLLKRIGAVDSAELMGAAERMMRKGDPRDVQAAFQSLQRIIRVA